MRKRNLLMVIVAIVAWAGAVLTANGQAATTNRLRIRTADVGESGQLVVGLLLRAPIPSGAHHPRYQWLRCNTHGARCSRIQSANRRLYRIHRADVDHTLRARITWRGGASVTTDATGLVHSSGGSSPQPVGSPLQPVGSPLQPVGSPLPPIALPLQPVGDPLGRLWTLAFDDEFNGTTIDSSRWAALNWSLNNETGKAADCTESGGSAVLALPGNGTGCDLSSAPGYGAGANGWTLNVGDYVEARVWFPGPGSSPTSTIDNWPAIWALGVNPGGSGEPAGEIDFAEALGKLEVNYHSNTANDSVATPPGNWGNSWHVYGVYRGPTEDQVFWDGNLVATVTTADNGGPETVILTSGGANSCCGAPSVTGAAGNVFVDWVRGWQ